MKLVRDRIVAVAQAGLAPRKWKSIGSACRSSFERRGADVVKRGVASDRISKVVDIAGKGLRGLVTGIEDGAPDELGFDRLEEGLHHRIVGAISLS